MRAGGGALSCAGLEKFVVSLSARLRALIAQIMAEATPEEVGARWEVELEAAARASRTEPPPAQTPAEVCGRGDRPDALASEARREAQRHVRRGLALPLDLAPHGETELTPNVNTPRFFDHPRGRGRQA